MKYHIFKLNWIVGTHPESSHLSLRIYESATENIAFFFPLRSILNALFCWSVSYLRQSQVTSRWDSVILKMLWMARAARICLMVSEMTSTESLFTSIEPRKRTMKSWCRIESAPTQMHNTLVTEQGKQEKEKDDLKQGNNCRITSRS